MEENKTTRVNRTVNYYSDRPDYDHYPERPHYDHCPERPEYDHHPVRPHYDHCPERPEYDHHPVRPEYDHHPVRPNHDHYPERPEYDHHPIKSECDHFQEKTKPSACCCPTEKKLNANECGACCEPLDVKCPDINCAICTPILAEKVFDFKCVTQKVPFRFERPTTFFVDPRSKGFSCYTPNSPVCIEKITVLYNCIGLDSESISGFLCNTPITLTDAYPQACNTCTGTIVNLYNNFQTTISPQCCCDGKGSSATLLLNDLNASICNYQFIVEGFIGCEPFTARAPQTPENGSSFLPPSQVFNLFTNICLPTCNDPVTLKAEFDLKYIARSVIPTTCFTPTNGDESDPCPTSPGFFDARILAELLIKESLYVTKQDALVVYSAPVEFKNHEK